MVLEQQPHSQKKIHKNSHSKSRKMRHASLFVRKKNYITNQYSVLSSHFDFMKHDDDVLLFATIIYFFPRSFWME